MYIITTLIGVSFVLSKFILAVLWYFSTNMLTWCDSLSQVTKGCNENIDKHVSSKNIFKNKEVYDVFEPDDRNYDQIQLLKKVT